MLRKKLLTVACALGILACGACFLPPLPAPRPTAPPVPIQPRWHDIYGVRVVATDVSDAHHVDGENLAMKVANRINWMARDTGIRAVASSQPGSEQAVLELKILKESATQSTFTSTSTQDRWLFSIEASVSLTDRNGQVLWQDPEPAVTYQTRYPWVTSIDRWNHGGMGQSLPEFLGERVAYRALYHP